MVKRSSNRKPEWVSVMFWGVLKGKTIRKKTSAKSETTMVYSQSAPKRNIYNVVINETAKKVEARSVAIRSFSLIKFTTAHSQNNVNNTRVTMLI
jgi:hypothetical protein